MLYYYIIITKAYSSTKKYIINQTQCCLFKICDSKLKVFNVSISISNNLQN